MQRQTKTVTTFHAEEVGSIVMTLASQLRSTDTKRSRRAHFRNIRRALSPFERLPRVIHTISTGITNTGSIVLIITGED